MPKKQGNVCAAAVMATTSQHGVTKPDRKTAQQRRKERARDARSMCARMGMDVFGNFKIVKTQLLCIEKGGGAPYVEY